MKIEKKIHPASIFKLLSNRNRFLIIENLMRTKDDLCVNEIAEKVGLSQSATSHQLAYLEALDVVESMRMGKTKCYMIRKNILTEKIKKIITSLT